MYMYATSTYIHTYIYIYINMDCNRFLAVTSCLFVAFVIIKSNEMTVTHNHSFILQQR